MNKMCAYCLIISNKDYSKSFTVGEVKSISEKLSHYGLLDYVFEDNLIIGNNVNRILKYKPHDYKLWSRYDSDLKEISAIYPDYIFELERLNPIFEEYKCYKYSEGKRIDEFSGILEWYS